LQPQPATLERTPSHSSSGGRPCLRPGMLFSEVCQGSLCRGDADTAPMAPCVHP